jgi:outer membrane immunogenic protein
VKRLLLATVSMAALASVARGAEMPSKAPIYAPAPVADWSGAYLGVQGGVVRRDATLSPFDILRAGDKTGGIVGALLGYNWQQGNFVYGLEGDWNWIGAKASGRSNLADNSSDSYDVNWLATLRGRAGLALDSTLFYVTGGVAFGHVENSVALLDGTGSVQVSFAQKETKAGWTVGAGVEHMLAPQWTARGEFRYADLGKSGTVCTPGIESCDSFSVRPTSSNTLTMGLVGLNYKFGASRAADWSHARAYAPPLAPIWTGVYLGVHGGGAHHDAYFNDSDGFFFSQPRLFERKKVGGAAGGLLGYNWQQGSFVYGVEGDWSWIGARTSEFLPEINGGGANFSSSFDVNWLVTVRGRAGLAFDATLAYVTGGAAVGHVKNSADMIGTGILNSGQVASFTQKQTKVGWTAGVGVEHMFSQHWTARAEFRYVDLGKTNVACSSATNFNQCVASGYRGDFSNTLKLGLVGLNYKF